MAKKSSQIEMFAQWKARSNGNYIAAICKPCWELKYCPYGILVEDFPIVDEESLRCRVYGHQCPAFTVSEPLTETKEPRNISRNIPTTVKMQVARRDRYRCAVCGKFLADDEINYDHIIPWSKGGSSEENNIRILCETCNKSRGNSFESQYLIVGVTECISKLQTLTMLQIEDLLGLMTLAHVLFSEKSRKFDYALFLNVISTGETSEEVFTDNYIVSVIESLYELLIEMESIDQVKKKAQMLKFRWGFIDYQVHSIDETCKIYNKDISYFFALENYLIGKIGYKLDGALIRDERYITMTIDKDEILTMLASS